MGLQMPPWLFSGLSLLETIAAISLGLFGIRICCKYREFVFSAVPMASLYIISFVGLAAVIGYVWFEHKNVETQLVMYFLDQVSSLAVQHCLIMILFEFYLPLRMLVQGNVMSESIASEKSYAQEAEAQKAKLSTNSRRIAIVLIVLLVADFCFFAFGIFVSIANTDATYFRMQLALVSLTLINTAVYLGVTLTLKRLVRKHFNNKFADALKSIMRVCYLLLLQNTIGLANQTAIYYYHYVSITSDRTLLHQINVTI